MKVLRLLHRAAGMMVVSAMATAVWTQAGNEVVWKHLSTKNGDLPAPNNGTQQTSVTVFDIDKDSVKDFVITERTATPTVVWYRRNRDGWNRYIIEQTLLKPEAGATFGDVDGDGDLDFIAGADGSGDTGNQVWWWENPYPNLDPAAPWERHTIKRSGGRKHHDLMFADVDSDGRAELVFWNQGAHSLILARIPADPRSAGEWPMTTIFTYSADGEMQQRATSPPFKTINEHEGLALADIDGDGKPDIVGGGYWFKGLAGDRYEPNTIDAGYHFSRAASGQLIEGGRPEVVFVVGDGVGPLVMYEWMKGTWVPHVLIEKIDNGHSLSLVDFNGDGHLDIFCAEMRLDGGNPEAKVYMLLGDGKGGFAKYVPITGFGNHESKIVDLDGNGTLDILGKPYNWDTPRLDIWLNMVPASVGVGK
jgi:hypothetical protein